MKFLFSLILAFLFVTSINAQFRNLRLGVSGEPLSLSFMNSDTPEISTERSGLASSIFFKAEYYFSPFASLASGVGFTVNQGGTLLYNEGIDVWADSDLVPAELHNQNEPTLYTSKIRYLEFPVALKLRTDELGKYRIFFEIPRMTIGVTTNASGNLKNDSLTEKDQNIYPSMSWMNLSYGVMAGVEYSISQNISGIIGFNWKQGFVDITDDVGVDSKITSGTFGLHAGILF